MKQPRGFGRHGPRNFGAPTEKPKNFNKTIRRFLVYLKPYRMTLFIVFVTAIFSTIFTVLAPLIIGDVVDVLSEEIIGSSNDLGINYQKVMISVLGFFGIDYQKVLTMILVLFVLYIASSVFSYIQQYLMVNVTQRTVARLRSEVGSKLSRLHLKYYDTHTHGEIMSRVINDVDNINTTLQQSITQLLTSFVTLAGISLIILYLNPILALVCLLILPISAVLTKIIVSRSQGYFKDQQINLARLNGHVEEMYTGHKIIKAFGREDKAIEKMHGINDDLYHVSWKAQFISGISMPVLYFVQNIGYVIVCIVGCLFILSGSMSIGNVQSFILYSKQFTQPITQISTVINTIQSMLASTEHVLDLLDAPEESSDPAVSPDFILKGHVAFDHVNFGYEKENPVIHDLSLNISPGETVALVGPTGAGKTTILNLLMRFYEVDNGRILIDGVDISTMKRPDLRKIFGMVLQTPWLFNGTIRENIAYGKDDATDEEIIRAAKMSYADDFIRLLPKGYDTVINENASNLSEGQKQMLTIARVFLSNPSILLLDEATSSVDTLTEVYIKEAFSNLMKGRTSFVIAHRLSTVKNADMILVINKGQIIEKGSHHELLKQNGFYAMLYNSQFTDVNMDETFKRIENEMYGSFMTQT
ncbi:MAG: ABC transporter ATP-binding protein/permease [Methanimicrococcus sp.]|nr:ABC transporter ATP-binding protein/permease [Methanimicrococcus sp.]